HGRGESIVRVRSGILLNTAHDVPVRTPLAGRHALFSVGIMTGPLIHAPQEPALIIRQGEVRAVAAIERSDGGEKIRITFGLQGLAAADPPPEALQGGIGQDARVCDHRSYWYTCDAAAHCILLFKYSMGPLGMSHYLRLRKRPTSHRLRAATQAPDIGSSGPARR